MRPWQDCKGLLELFSIPRGFGADRFCDLVDMGALLLRFDPGQRLSDLERCIMAELGVSPLVYWAAMKRAVRPLLAAGGDTLRALGIPVKGEPRSVHQLAEAVVSVLAPELPPEAAEEAQQIGERVMKYADR